MLSTLYPAGTSTVIEAVLFASSGCHFVLAEPSTAAMGNCPGRYGSGEVTVWHCAMLSATVRTKFVMRLGTVMEESWERENSCVSEEPGSPTTMVMEVLANVALGMAPSPGVREKLRERVVCVWLLKELMGQPWKWKVR